MSATPSAQYRLTIRVKLDDSKGMLLGAVTSAIGEAGGMVGAVDLVVVHVLAIALAGIAVGEHDDAVGWEGTQRVLDRLQRIALAGVPARCNAFPTEALHRLGTDLLGLGDGRVGIRQPELDRAVVQRRGHDHDLGILGIQSAR